MATIEVTKEQLQLIQRALDFYSRIGIGQFTEIKDHPSFERSLEKACTPKKTPEIGDSTPQGKILKVKRGYALIAGSVKDNRWNEEHEWKKLKDVKLSPDYGKYHEIRDIVDNRLTECRNLLIQDFTVGRNGSWGIFNEEADDSCRVAYDLVQVIRHEFWKAYPKRSMMTVDSSVQIWTNDGDKIKCSLDEEEVKLYAEAYK
jgi:hypothetical protein